jgi:predicted MFS family arabinose efflux permease
VGKISENKNLYIIALIAIVNALGYGIIIPVLYSYSQKYGMSDFQNGLLFALFSICQFLSTPIIGRMSDKFGRRPLLIGSLTGTAASFFLMAFAPNMAFLFLARALDGITAGNIPVASAVITDTTDEKNRAKGFGVIGASFGFGFIFGPAITAFTVRFGDSVPFIIAGVISIIAVIVTSLLLPETNKHMGEVKKGKLFDFKSMAKALTDPNVGPTLLITLVYATAFSLLIYAFQPFAVKGLHLSVDIISILFTLVGVAGLITQIVILPFVTKRWHVKDVFTNAFLLITILFVAIFFSMNLYYYAAVTMIWSLVNNLINPLIQTILSEETDAKSQGAMQGLNASYMSIGQIIGPILGGAVATIGISYPFLLGGAFALACYFLSFRVLRKGVAKEAAF